MKRRFSLAELEARCQKLDHQRLGNWMARRVSRPLALRVTRIVAPWGVSANAVTLAAWLVALVAALACGLGTPLGFVIGAILLQTWYLLDHVDGQLARLRRSESLDGVALDYLMHHAVNAAVPLGIGYGLARGTGQELWALVGLAWSIGLLVVGLANDVRYKAFVQRLKRVRGELRVVGGAGGRPMPAARMPNSLLPLVKWSAAKLCETHVLMNLLAVVATLELLLADRRPWGIAALCAAAATAAVLRAIKTIRELCAGDRVEAEFARWYQPPEGAWMAFEEGWWVVRRLDGARISSDACQ